MAVDRLPHGYAPKKNDGYDAAAALRTAVAGDRLREAVEAAAPPLTQYARLRDALARYRTMDGGAWMTPLPPLPPLPGLF